MHVQHVFACQEPVYHLIWHQTDVHTGVSAGVAMLVSLSCGVLRTSRLSHCLVIPLPCPFVSHGCFMDMLVILISPVGQSLLLPPLHSSSWSAKRVMCGYESMTQHPWMEHMTGQSLEHWKSLMQKFLIKPEECLHHVWDFQSDIQSAQNVKFVCNWRLQMSRTSQLFKVIQPEFWTSEFVNSFGHKR